MNTILGIGDFEITLGFNAFRDWVNRTSDLNAGRLIKRATPNLIKAEIDAYNAPFPDISYKAGVRRFPNLVPTTYEALGAEISRKARGFFPKDWKGESFMTIGIQDPVLGPSVMRLLRRWIPGIPKPLEIKEAGHFVQDWGEIVAEKALEAFNL
jgi:haloalkane dehalogenase/tRNA(adenine34) deaminase